MTIAIDWTGRTGDVWASEWRRTDRALSELGQALDAAVLAAAPPGPFTALDIGCGAGATSLALARARPDAEVTGVDLSAGFVAVARERAGDLQNARFVTGDALSQAAAIRPDLYMSRHGVMFFADPTTAFATLRAAAAPRATLVFTCFAAVADNPWATLITDAPARASGYVPGPFAFADPATVKSLLAATGWRATAERVAFSYAVGTGDDPVADAVSFVSRIGPAASVLRDAEESERAALLAHLHDRLESQRRGDLVAFPAAAWLWTARA